MLASRARTRWARRLATLLVMAAMALPLGGFVPSPAVSKPMPAAASYNPDW
jgi:hypothetical protein